MYVGTPCTMFFSDLNRAISKSSGDEGPFSYRVRIVEDWPLEDNEPVCINHNRVYADIMSLFDASLCSHTKYDKTINCTRLSMYLEIENIS